MNTFLDIVLWGIDQGTAEKASASIIKKVKGLQKILDRYDRDAETFQINRDAFTQKIKVSECLMQAIQHGIKDFHRTLGYFNIFAGEAYSALKNGKQGDVIHTHNLLPEEIIEADAGSNTIRFLKEFVSLDFGGIGKGLALDEAGVILNEYGISNAFISFGGSSILTRGRHPHGNYWPFSFRDKSIEHEVWELTDDAISISCAKGGNVNFTHIWNPKANKPALSEQISGIQSQRATEAEVLSTALTAAPPKWHQKIASGFDIKKWVVFGIQ
jgi:thiamine biosynthesis lipoprotein